MMAHWLPVYQGDGGSGGGNEMKFRILWFCNLQIFEEEERRRDADLGGRRGPR